MVKKKSHGQASAKLGSGKSAKQNFAHIDATREQAEKVVKLGNNVVKDFLATSADEAHKTQEKLFSISREGAESMAKSADTVSKALYDTVGISRDNMEACLECGNLTAALTKDLSSELFENANRAFSETAEMSKEFLACRTLNDMVELNNKLLRHTVDNFFSQSAKMSSMMFEYASEAMEPINERATQTVQKLSKTLAA